jgi:nucleoid-associated protein YgaU
MPHPPVQAAAAASPQVESYDEDTYAIKANDTFGKISQAVYQTDQYERSLMLFNRSHPLASNALREDPPVLQAGQAVYIPPVRILEKYYGAPVLASPPSAVAPSPRPPAGDRLDPAGSVRPANLALADANTPFKTGPLYRVRDGGEMVREIAIRTLGNGDRWWEIYQLNPRFDPKEAIPGGSQLQMPKDARVNP